MEQMKTLAGLGAAVPKSDGTKALLRVTTASYHLKGYKKTGSKRRVMLVISREHADRMMTSEEREDERQKFIEKVTKDNEFMDLHDQVDLRTLRVLNDQTNALGSWGAEGPSVIFVGDGNEDVVVVEEA